MHRGGVALGDAARRHAAQRQRRHRAHREQDALGRVAGFPAQRDVAARPRRDGPRAVFALAQLDEARWIGGEIKGLQALASNRYGEPNYPHDNIVVNVEFESGAIGTFYFNSSSPALKPWERVEVFGNRKWLAVEDQMTVTLHDSDEGPSKVWSPVLPTTLFFDEEFSGFTHQLLNFVQAVRGDAAPAVTGDDGIAALRIAQMIHVAARERRYVSYHETE